MMQVSNTQLYHNMGLKDKKRQKEMETNVNLIIGRAGTGKTTEILNRVREDIERNDNVYLIVPEQFSYTFERKITDSFSSVLNLQILSFSRLVEQILSDSKYRNKVYLDDISRTIILDNILDKVDLLVLKNKDKNIEAISNIIEEFKKYDIKLNDLKLFIDTQKEKEITRSIIKLEEIYNIYLAYNEEIKDKFLDIADREYEVLDIIDKNIEFKGSKIYIDQFAKFTEGEYKIIEKMLKQADQVNIAITADGIHKKSDYEVFFTTKNTISDLIQIAQSQNKKINIIEKMVNIKHELEMKSFEESMFEEKEVLDRESHENQANITLKVYKSIEEEIEELAENIMQEIIEKEYKFNDIAVVFNDINSQENLIRRVFKKYNIPVYLEIEKRLEQNSIARYILDLLEVIVNNYNINSVFSFLKLAYTNFSGEDVYLLEKYVLRWNVRGSTWKSDWKNYDKLSEEDFNKIISLKNNFVEFVENFKEKIGRSKSAKDISIAIYNLLEEEKIFDKSIKEIDDLDIDDSRKLELKAEYTSSLNLLQESLDRIVLIQQDNIISYEKYYNLFALVSKETIIKQIPSINDAIHFITTKTLNLEDIKSLYIVSLEDGLYPLLSSYTGLISDEEKLFLKANNIKLSETDIERLADDDYNMYSVLLIPSTSLHLSYHISDLEGNSKRPSIYINKIKKRLRYLEEENRIKGLYKEEVKIYSNKALLDKVLTKYLDYLEEKNIEDEWKYLIYVLQQTSPEFKMIEKNILDKNIAPNLSLDILEKLYRKDLYTSISRLEEYAKCPFSYFVRYTLNILEEKKYELNPLNTGILLHDVLEEFAELIKNKKISLEDINSKLLFLPEKDVLKLRAENQEYNKSFTEVMSYIDKITDQIISEKLQEDKYKMFMLSPKFELYTNKFINEIKNATKILVNTLRLSDFSILGNEINIGSDFKESKYTLKNGRITQIYGQIDRADILKYDDKTYLRIVDYKSSINYLDENKIRAGLQIQLLTYLNILAKEKGFEPSAALYFGLAPSIKKANVKTEAELNKALRNSYKMQGVLLADHDIVRAMDKSLDSGFSDILPVGMTKAGDFDSRSKVQEKEGFDKLRKSVENSIISMSENIMQGDISIYPYKYKDELGCKYCPYMKICNFDVKKNKYRIIKAPKKEESKKEESKKKK